MTRARFEVPDESGEQCVVSASGMETSQERAEERRAVDAGRWTSRSSHFLLPP